jgi:hypothetical protein
MERFLYYNYNNINMLNRDSKKILDNFILI